MAATIHSEKKLRDEVDVRRWRFEQLVRHGFRPDDADSLARDPQVDLATARRLVGRGCSPDLAVRILA